MLAITTVSYFYSCLPLPPLTSHLITRHFPSIRTPKAAFLSSTFYFSFSTFPFRLLISSSQLLNRSTFRPLNFFKGVRTTLFF